MGVPPPAKSITESDVTDRLPTVLLNVPVLSAPPLSVNADEVGKFADPVSRVPPEILMFGPVKGKVYPEAASVNMPVPIFFNPPPVLESMLPVNEVLLASPNSKVFAPIFNEEPVAPVSDAILSEVEIPEISNDPEAFTTTAVVSESEPPLPSASVPALMVVTPV